MTTKLHLKSFNFDLINKLYTVCFHYIIHAITQEKDGTKTIYF